MGALLEVQGISAGYGDITVLRDVSLTVKAGRATVLLGRNGAGKTTLLSAIAGLLPVDSGAIDFDGSDVSSVPAHRRSRAGIALVQENKRVFRARTVEENLRLGGFAMGRRTVAAAVDSAYARFPVLAARRSERASSLSGGQQQMLAIAQALMPSPSLLMLDEPSAGLAPIVVREVLDTVMQLKEEGIGVLLVEQLVDQALSVADDVVILDRGKVVSTAGADAHDLGRVRDVYLGAR